MLRSRLVCLALASLVMGMPPKLPGDSPLSPTCGPESLTMDGCDFTASTCASGQYAAKCNLELVTPGNRKPGMLGVGISRSPVCVDCPAGYFSPVDDSRKVCNFCQACGRDSIAAYPRALSCVPCVHGHTSTDGATRCECDNVQGIQWINDAHGNCMKPPKDGEGMEGSSIRVDDAPIDNYLAGVPGMEGPEFPDNLEFGQPCVDMEEKEAPVVVPVPTPTPQMYPEESHIAWEIVSVIREISGFNRCNFTRDGVLSLAVSIWHALPSANTQNNTCPLFLSTHPLFPETPTPTPAPTDLLREEQEKMENLRRMIENAENQGNTEEVLRLKEKLDRIDVGAKARVTLNEENKSTLVLPYIPPQPLPADCSDDTTGSVGVSNDDVAGATSGMNREFHPLPVLYNPRGRHEPLPLRERIIGARSTMESLSLLEESEQLADDGCTLFKGTTLSPNTPPFSSLPAPLPRDCERACLFDDDCDAWVWVRQVKAAGNREDSNCRLYSEDSPVLLASPEGQPSITGVCPKTKLCSRTTIEAIQNLSHNANAVSLHCPALIESISSGQSIDRQKYCPCIQYMKLMQKSEGMFSSRGAGGQMDKSSCLISEKATVSWVDAMSACDGYGLPAVELNLVQSRLRDCSGTSIFDAGTGGCETYAKDYPNSNHVHCSTDYDHVTRKFAKDACSECGACAATPTPPPDLPPPSLHSGFTLDNGDSTPCLDARKSAAEKSQTGPLAGWYSPTCYADGSYTPTQCFENECWCVYENGVEIPATRFERSQKDTANRPECRPEPEMGLVYPSSPVIVADRRRVAIRELSKLIYAMVQPEMFCRPGDSRNLEKIITLVLESHHLHNATKLSCPPSSPLPLTLTHLASFLLPPPVRRTSPSPSNSPSPSPTAAPSSSPSASPSAPVPMCGGVACANLGILVHMHRNPLPGECSVCVEGTSGPCRDDAYVCSGFQYGGQCGVGRVRCGESGVGAGGLDAACREHSGARFELVATLSLPTTTSLTAEWTSILASSLSDTLVVPNLCDLSIRVEQGNRAESLVGITRVRPTFEESNTDLSKLVEVVSDGSLLENLSRRGVPLAADSSISILGIRVAQEYNSAEKIGNEILTIPEVVPPQPLAEYPDKMRPIVLEAVSTFAKLLSTDCHGLADSNLFGSKFIVQVPVANTVARNVQEIIDFCKSIHSRFDEGTFSMEVGEIIPSGPNWNGVIVSMIEKGSYRTDGDNNLNQEFYPDSCRRSSTSFYHFVFSPETFRITSVAEWHHVLEPTRMFENPLSDTCQKFWKYNVIKSEGLSSDQANSPKDFPSALRTAIQNKVSTFTTSMGSGNCLGLFSSGLFAEGSLAFEAQFPSGIIVATNTTMLKQKCEELLEPFVLGSHVLSVIDITPSGADWNNVLVKVVETGEYSPTAGGIGCRHRSTVAFNLVFDSSTQLLTRITFWNPVLEITRIYENPTFPQCEALWKYDLLSGYGYYWPPTNPKVPSLEPPTSTVDTTRVNLNLPIVSRINVTCVNYTMPIWEDERKTAQFESGSIFIYNNQTCVQSTLQSTSSPSTAHLHPIPFNALSIEYPTDFETSLRYGANVLCGVFEGCSDFRVYARYGGKELQFNSAGHRDPVPDTEFPLIAHQVPLHQCTFLDFCTYNGACAVSNTTYPYPSYDIAMRHVKCVCREGWAGQLCSDRA